MPSYLITGASRGLGHGFTQELLKNPDNHVIATARKPSESKGLQELAASSPKGKLDIVQLDIVDPASIKNAVEEATKLLPDGLDVFLGNAGAELSGGSTFEGLSGEILNKEFDYLVTANLHLIQAFLPLIRKGKEKKIVVISSTLGSLESAFYMPGLADSYGLARAGLNYLIRKWSGVFKFEEIKTAIIHPGWVPVTELGGSVKEWIEKYSPDLPRVTGEDSAAGVVKIIERLTIEETGLFWNYDGTKLPW